MMKLAKMTIFVMCLCAGQGGWAERLILTPGTPGAGDAEKAVQEFGIKYSREYSDHMKRFSKIMISKALKEGQSKAHVGWVNLSLLIKEVDSIKVYHNESDQLLTGSGGRVGAVNLVEGGGIVLNTTLLNQLTQLGTGTTAFSSIGVEAMILHEVLGALGYPDDNYEVSTYIYMRSLPTDYTAEVMDIAEKNLEHFFIENPRRSLSARFESGTSTGVGGGGDPIAAAIKLTTLAVMGQNKAETLRAFKISEAEFVRLVSFIQRIQLEPLKVPYPYAPSTSMEPSRQVLQVRLQSPSRIIIEFDPQIVHFVKSQNDLINLTLNFISLCRDAMLSGVYEQ